MVTTGFKPSWSDETNSKDSSPVKKEVKKATPKQLNYLANLLGTISTNPDFIATYADQPAYAISKIIDAKLKE